jgi:short-subunit dehydrogenase
VPRVGLALVTGASSGIGRAITLQLAREGYDLVVVARGQAGLEDLVRECASFSTQVDPVSADLSTDGGISAIEDVIFDREPAVVVNCAGAGWKGAFSAQPPETLASLLSLDVISLTRLSHAALSVMVRRGSGSLLNVSSTASFVPGPTVAAYHASKAFVTSLTEALHVEVADTAVHVTALCPGITPTGFQARAGTEHAHLPSLLTTSAERVAREGLAAMRKNDALCVPGAANKVIVALAKFAPRRVVRWAAGRFIAAI